MRNLQQIKKKLQKASDRVRNAFCVENMVRALYLMDKYYLSIRTTAGAVRFNYQELLSNPCFLLIAYNTLKKKKSGGIDNIPVENVTLGGILALSISLGRNNYKPNPSR
jgi:hypothetical protein